MKIRFLIIVVIVTSVGFQGIPHTFALSCGISSFSESYERHDLLLHGKLVEKNSTNTRGASQMITSLTFDTIKVYKGEHRDSFTIRADLSFDDFYRIGEDYVLFADKDGDDYLRDFCVPDYISSDGIIMFLDDYSKFSFIGFGVYSLYEVVDFPKRPELSLKMYTYSELNRGETFLNRTQESDMTKIYSCDFEEALANSAKSSHIMSVYDFIENNPLHETNISFDLASNPQMGKITYIGEKEILEESVINAKIFANCFFVYDIRVIDRDTEKTTTHINSKDAICMVENSQEIFPDFCTKTSQESPKVKNDLQPTYIRSWIIDIVLIGIILGLLAAGTFFAIKLWRKRK